ncbi:hypothetical protein K449DRAFT_433087 [Hypoxylon sp. EC38]|nr:hypothetical protein K449DRAFT_433087 [Hypoxylon sp. EC38]
MADCSVEGNSDMYGLGIRLGFYLNWYAGILANFIAAEEIESVQYAMLSFITATFVAVVVQTAHNTVTVLDTYITLLLCFGYNFFLIPIYIWRLLTGFNKGVDPTRWSRVHHGSLFHAYNLVLTMSVAIFQLWFWTSEAVRSNTCPYYGFLLRRSLLSSVEARIVNITLQAFIIFILVQFAAMLLRDVLSPKKSTKDPDESTSLPKRRKTRLQTIYPVILLVIASIVTAATELTIAWNDITDVSDLDTAGQLIPFLISLGIIGRPRYKQAQNLEDPKDAGGIHSRGGSVITINSKANSRLKRYYRPRQPRHIRLLDRVV